MDKRTLVAFICTLVLLGVGVAVGVYYGLTIGNRSDDNTRVEPIMDSRGAALSFFSQSDGLDIRWFSKVNTSTKLSQALSGDYMMLSTEVSLGVETPANASDASYGIVREPVVGESSSSFTLKTWLQRLKTREKIGLKLSFRSLDALGPTLTVLNSADLGTRPVWLEANIVTGTGDQPIVDSSKFVQQVRLHYPRAVLSFGWTTECCQGTYTQDLVERMYSLVQDVNAHITFMVRSSWLNRQSQDSIRWLLKQSNRYSITVWSPPESPVWEGVNVYDLVKLRNEHYVDRIYYQLQGKMFDSFVRMAMTAGNPLNVFKMPRRDGIDITWVHATNSREEHNRALQGSALFLEADVIVNTEGVPIMAHPPATTSDLTFSDFVDGTMLTLKGMKIDFKRSEAINPALRYLQSKYPMIHQPVWLNADVLPGPGGGQTPPVDGNTMLRYVRNRFPQCTLSLGWTTGISEDAGQYTTAQIDAMLALIANVQQPITFPVRADLVRPSWAELSRLLATSPAYSLTIWSNQKTEHLVNVDDLVWVRAQNLDKSRVFYDLPERTMHAFRSRL